MHFLLNYYFFGRVGGVGGGENKNRPSLAIFQMRWQAAAELGNMSSGYDIVKISFNVTFSIKFNFLSK